MATRASREKHIIASVSTAVPAAEAHPVPATLYQGSKQKLAGRIWKNIRDFEFTSALDAFGGTGCVAHMLKTSGKRVVYNDILGFNHAIGKALIGNRSVTLSEDGIRFVSTRDPAVEYPSFISDNFRSVFFLDGENERLDMAAANIARLDNPYRVALARFALFQARIVKRPYNLFHRANLKVRTRQVVRTFGNKKARAAPFADHFAAFAREANRAVFDNGLECEALNVDALEIERKFDLVYIDTPFISKKGVGKDYLDFYHFLEGLSDYDGWGGRLLKKYRHLPLAGKGKNEWTKKDLTRASFDRLFEKFRNSVIVVSYREDGILASRRWRLCSKGTNGG